MAIVQSRPPAWRPEVRGKKWKKGRALTSHKSIQARAAQMVYFLWNGCETGYYRQRFTESIDEAILHMDISQLCCNSMQRKISVTMLDYLNLSTCIQMTADQSIFHFRSLFDLRRVHMCLLYCSNLRHSPPFFEHIKFHCIRRRLWAHTGFRKITRIVCTAVMLRWQMEHVCALSYHNESSLENISNVQSNTVIPPTLGPNCF